MKSKRQQQHVTTFVSHNHLNSGFTRDVFDEVGILCNIRTVAAFCKTLL